MEKKTCILCQNTVVTFQNKVIQVYISSARYCCVVMMVCLLPIVLPAISRQMMHMENATTMMIGNWKRKRETTVTLQTSVAW